MIAQVYEVSHDDSLAEATGHRWLYFDTLKRKR
jgi:hypothetical protein